MPKAKSVLFPPSHCPNCSTKLRAFELIPVLSWLVLLGRCRTCKTDISICYPVTETVTGLLFALTAMQVSTWSKLFAWCFFWLVLVAAFACDINAMKVPNVISYGGGAFVFVFAVTCEIQPWYTVVSGGFVCFVTLLAIHFISGGRMGLGDAKLYLSIGMMLGPWYGLLSLAFAAATGTVIGLFMRVISLVGKFEYIPFVPFICAGVVLTVFYGHAFVQWYSQTILLLR